MLQTLHATWWAWAILALALAFLEIIVPAFVFLGMTIGAACVALVMLLGGTGSIGAPVSVLIFAVTSLVATLILRRIFSLPKGQVKTFEGDIND
jgi:membrane protein implicated in regulation of membrane protease activity